jgi:NAD dependent epimerase/dehydratase family enzyme
MADSLLAGACVAPARLTAAGFRFHHPTLAGALDHVLGVHSAYERAQRAA